MTSLPWISIPTVALFFAEVRGYSKLYDSVDDSPLGQLKNILTSFQLFYNLFVSMKFMVLMWSMCFQVGLGSSWVWSPSCFSLTCVSIGFIASYIISSFTRWAQLCQSTITETWIWVQTFFDFHYDAAMLTTSQYDCIYLMCFPSLKEFGHVWL